MTIYDNVKRICEEKGISISSIENRFGFTRGTIYKWGESAPSVVRAKSIADYLGVSVDSLLDGVELGEKTT